MYGKVVNNIKTILNNVFNIVKKMLNHTVPWEKNRMVKNAAFMLREEEFTREYFTAEYLNMENSTAKSTVH